MLQNIKTHILLEDAGAIGTYSQQLNSQFNAFWTCKVDKLMFNCVISEASVLSPSETPNKEAKTKNILTQPYILHLATAAQPINMAQSLSGGGGFNDC